MLLLQFKEFNNTPTETKKKISLGKRNSIKVKNISTTLINPCTQWNL
jgi:hypothetical protein